VAPVDALVRCNGYPEQWCDGMGYEDTIMGTILHNAGYEFNFNPDMETWECETSHHNQPTPLRIDPGTSPNDKSHAVRSLAKLLKECDNNFGEFSSFAKMKQHYQATNQWPIPTEPRYEWFTRILLNKFHEYKPQSSSRPVG
jgi:hypothetical protein